MCVQVLVQVDIYVQVYECIFEGELVYCLCVCVYKCVYEWADFLFLNFQCCRRRGSRRWTTVVADIDIKRQNFWIFFSTIIQNYFSTNAEEEAEEEERDERCFSLNLKTPF